MSCENPSGTEEALMPKRRKLKKTGMCIKCKATPGRLVIRHAVYCKPCFLMLVTSKFRLVLNPVINFSDVTPPSQRRGALKAPGNLMIGFSGGLGSTVLLDLVKSCHFTHTDAAMSKGGKDHPRRTGRAWDRAIVCYVECAEAYDAAVDRIHDVSKALEPYKDFFEFESVRLEDAFKASSGEVDMSREDLPLSNNNNISDVSSVSLLKTYLSSLPTATSYQSSISSLIRLLLQHTARIHGCSHLLLGTSLTSLSVNLIEAVANGAGYTLAFEKSEDWQSPGSAVVRVVRPLREISMKECAAYSRWRNLSVIGNERLLSAHTSHKDSSIPGLTKDFIFGLERDYPSTVNAIVRTCDKLVPNTVGEKCALCARPTQPGIQEWKERISIRNMDLDNMNFSNRNIENAGDAEFAKRNTYTLTSSLCYSCHTTLTSRSSRSARRLAGVGDALHHVPLPNWVGNTLHTKRTAGEMREQIQEFLISTDVEDG